jgi:hypothetical protein
MYTLTLSEQDIATIAFVGNRYSWSDALYQYEAGVNEVPEHEAWEINEAFHDDTIGGHSMFPMLDHTSDLCQKLITFSDNIV